MSNNPRQPEPTATQVITDLKARVDMRAFLSSVHAILGPWKEVSKDRWEGTEHDSLVIEPDKRYIHWNGQPWHGDIIDFLKEWCGLDTRGAIDYLRRLNGDGPAALGIDLASLAEAPADPGPKRPEGAPPTEALVAFLNRQLLKNQPALNWVLRRYGLTVDDVEFYRLGYVDNLWNREGPGIFFPIHYQDKLVAGRVRLMTDGDGSRYRPWAKSCGAWAWGLDAAAQADEFVIGEGEFKAMRVSKCGRPMVGLPGVDSFIPSVTPEHYATREAFEAAYWGIFAGKKVFVALDPGQDALWRMVRDISTKAIINMARREWMWKLMDVANVYIADLPMKPDDLINQVGMDSFLACLDAAQPARFLAKAIRVVNHGSR